MAGRDLDALVAERVMDWRRSDDPNAIGAAMFGKTEPLWCIADSGRLIVARRENPGEWRPSTDIAAAWEVVDRLIALGWTVDIEQWNTVQGKQWRCDLHRQAPWGVEDGFADTAPLAICRAALAAVGAPQAEATGGAS